MNFLKILNEIVLKKGITYNLNTGEINPPDGFMVSLPGHERVVPYIDEGIIREYVTDYATELADENNYFGCWFDGVHYVLDVSRKVTTKRNAIFYGIAWRQRAIWDNEKKNEIRIKQYERWDDRR